MEKLVIIVPCYNEEKMLPIFYQEVESVMAQIKDIAWEYLLVDDGSADGTLEVMKSLRARDDRVTYR